MVGHAGANSLGRVSRLRFPVNPLAVGRQSGEAHGVTRDKVGDVDLRLATTRDLLQVWVSGSPTMWTTGTKFS
jgi:hypothetical protein